MRARILVTVLVSVATHSAAAVSPVSRETAADALLAGKTPAQIHSPIVAYHQPVPVQIRVATKRSDSATAAQASRLSMPADSKSPKGANGGRGASSNSATPGNPRGNPSGPVYGGPDDSGDTPTRRSSRGADPCSGSGYHDNVMAHGLDSARVKCELHALDNNRGLLWGFAGGDPLLHGLMDKQLDFDLGLFGVSK